jgi:hypothetical protein
VDAQLRAPAEVVFVHGDFHPYNQLWDAQAAAPAPRSRLRDERRYDRRTKI